ncbi:MAG: suppressor of fused domain protein, partial [Lachnospiraceae bacterium]|nr:suppressor of fused domain protein [Lachnospiraceae bacterium]
MKKKKHKGPESGAEFPVMYEEEEWNAVEKSISKYFGDYETVLHEIASPDIHVDICMIPPALQDGRDYYTLVTFGMGAYRMNVPEELAEQKLERAELFIKLPADWRMDDEALRDERWY